MPSDNHCDLFVAALVFPAIVVAARPAKNLHPGHRAAPIHQPCVGRVRRGIADRVGWRHPDRPDAIQAVAQQQPQIVLGREVPDARLLLPQPSLGAEVLEEGVQPNGPGVFSLRDG